MHRVQRAHGPAREVPTGTLREIDAIRTAWGPRLAAWVPALAPVEHGLFLRRGVEPLRRHTHGSSAIFGRRPARCARSGRSAGSRLSDRGRAGTSGGGREASITGELRPRGEEIGASPLGNRAKKLRESIDESSRVP